jgi:hypothetical protein
MKTLKITCQYPLNPTNRNRELEKLKKTIESSENGQRIGEKK